MSGLAASRAGGGWTGSAARRVWGLVYRHLCLYRRSWPRVLDIAYWPILQMCIWGFTASFFAARLGSPAAVAGGALLGGVLLWEIALRSQMGLSITFLEEIWSRNLGHVFVSPVRPSELLAALVGISVLRTAIGVIPAALLAFALYAFDLLAVGPALLPFVVCLMVMGWAVALLVVSLILRHGQGAEALAWSLLFGLAPFSAVFYPVAILPAWARAVSWLLPSSHVFEGMRAVMGQARVAGAAATWGGLPWPELGRAVALDAAWLLVACLVFAVQFRRARERGALISIGE